MEILDSYKFPASRDTVTYHGYYFEPPFSVRDAPRNEFVKKLCDGKIYKFHKTELPNSRTDNNPKTVQIVVMNRIKRLYPKSHINCEIDGDYIIIQVLVRR